MKLLDLFCGAGGAAKGYHDAGFDTIIGIDIEKQSKYPYWFRQYDAIEYLETVNLQDFDLIHASPPCQGYTWSTRKGREETYGTDLIPKLRNIFINYNIPYVIENVPNAPLIDPVVLQGSMFNLGIIRKRLFETNWPLYAPEIGINNSNLITVAGHNKGTLLSRSLAMGINWMTREQLTQSVPPAYTKYIGEEFIELKLSGQLQLVDKW